MSKKVLFFDIWSSSQPKRSAPSSIGHRGDVRVSEVISFEKQRLTRNPGERVAKAVAKIQPGGMPPLAIATPGLPSDLSLLRRNRFDGEAGLGDEQVQLATAC